MLEDLKHIGEWYLPNTDKKVIGVLTYNSSRGIELELFGDLIDRKEFKTPTTDIILGISNSGKKITLYDCFETNRTTNSFGKTTSKFVSQYLFIGNHFESEDELVFDSIYSRLYNLDDWMKIYGFKLFDSSFNDKTTQLEYSRPDSIDFKISQTLTGKINFTYIPPFIEQTNKITIEQKSEFYIKSKQTENFKDLLSKFSHFQNFITFSTFKPSYPILLKLSNSSITRNNRNIKSEIPLIIDFYYRHSYLINRKDNYKHNIFLFDYQDIKSNFQTIIEKWYEIEKSIKPITSILIDSFYSKGVFDENSFLNVVQGIETFHRRFRKNKIIGEIAHQKRKREVLSNLPIEHQDWIKSILNFSNEPTLHMRIDEILSELDIQTIKNIIKDKEQFIRDVKNSRNYYTHYDKKLEKKAKKTSELFQLKEKLKVILLAIVLKETGLEKTQIEKLLKDKEWIFFNHLLI
jgi:hypothetical protein